MIISRTCGVQHGPTIHSVSAHVPLHSLLLRRPPLLLLEAPQHLPKVQGLHARGCTATHSMIVHFVTVRSQACNLSEPFGLIFCELIARTAGGACG